MRKLLLYFLTTLRFAAFLILTTFGTLLVVLTTWLPFEYDGSRWSAWIVTWICRIGLPITNIQLAPYDRNRIRQHQGFIFPNHQSYIDAAVMMSIRPMRYLAKAELSSWPFIGTVMRRVGTVFVKREDKQSRADSRAHIAKLGSIPPFVIFPEGKIETTFELQPYRYGAFDIALESGFPILPVVLIYEPAEVARWMQDNILHDIWVTLLGTPIRVKIHVLDVIVPEEGMVSAEIAEQVQQQVNAIYEPTIGDLPVSAPSLEATPS